MSKLFFTFITIFAFSFGAMAQDVQESQDVQQVQKSHGVQSMEIDAQSNELILNYEDKREPMRVSLDSELDIISHKKNLFVFDYRNRDHELLTPLTGNLALDLKKINSLPQFDSSKLNLKLNEMDPQKAEFYSRTIRQYYSN